MIGGEWPQLVAMTKQHGPGRHHPALPGYAQASQDLFASWVCGGPGIYLELGAFHPCCLSNTLWLEESGWSGESIEIRGDFAEEWRRWRRNPLIVGDAVDGLAERIDRVRPHYLSVDVDEENEAAIWALVTAEHRPMCLTVETNEHLDGGRFGKLAAGLLEAVGFRAIARSVSVCGIPFESWWVGPGVKREPLGDRLDHFLLAQRMFPAIVPASSGSPS